MIVQTLELRTLASHILTAAGASAANANCVASHLVNANVRGVDTHGVWHLPGYVAAIKRGELLPQATPELFSSTPATALVTGNWGFGQVTGIYAMQEAMCRAHTCGIAVVSIVQTHHFGRLGEYAESAARQGFISVIWVSGLGETKPVVVPYGGTTPVFGTNPLAIGLPAANEAPIVVDFATSATSGVKIIEAIRKGTIVPSGWLVNKHGIDTTNPHELNEGGGQLPFGEHKGYGLTLAVEILGRIFSGSDGFVEPPRGGYAFSNQGATMIALKADLFQPLGTYLRRTSQLRDRVRAVPPAPGFKEVSLPGDPESYARAAREREGIPIPDDLWETLTSLSVGDHHATN